jgi:hypothetical protein
VEGLGYGLRNEKFPGGFPVTEGTEGSEGFPQTPKTSGLDDLVIYRPVAIGVEISGEVNGRSFSFGEEQEKNDIITIVRKK